MGWTYCDAWTSPKAVQDELMRDFNRMETEGQFKILDKASTKYGRNFYVAIEDKAGERHILCIKINGNPQRGFGYKDMEESMGPVGMEDCPMRLLAIAAFDESKLEPFLTRYLALRSAEWKEREAVVEEAVAAGLSRSDMWRAGWRHDVREYHVRATTQFKAGDEVLIYGKPYTVVEKKGRSYRVRNAQGMVFKSTPVNMREMPVKRMA